MSGYRVFTEELARVAAATADGRLVEIVDGLRAPLVIGVFGRAGAGCTTIARALRTAHPPGAAWQIEVDVEPGTADLHVYVFAETLKPEDRDFLARSPRPCIPVLSKADLAGFGGQGPLSAAAARCRAIERETGVQTYPVAGLLAVAAGDERAVDAATIDALRILAADPADLGSVDGFRGRPHRLPVQIRETLLEHLDLFGIAVATVAVRGGADAGGVRRLLGRTSGISGLLAAIDLESAAAGYRRIQAVLPLLTGLSAGVGGGSVAELVATDDFVLARQAAASDVVSAAGLVVGDLADRPHSAGPSSPDALLRRAVFWRTYSEGPVSELHRACAADIARAALRLWSGVSLQP